MRATPIRIAVLGTALLACSSGGSTCAMREGERPSPLPAPVKAVTPAAGIAALADGWVLLERHEATSGTAAYRAVFVGAGGAGPVRVGEEIERPALARADWPGHVRAVVAFDGGRFALAEAVATPSGERSRVVVERVDGARAAPLSVDLADVVPTALHVARQTLFVGAIGRVGVVDLGAAPPVVRDVVTRAGDFRKPYDLFVREGDVLLAIDDEVTPVFADLFRLDARGAPTRLADLRLPPMINGHYRAAALAPDGPEAWTAYAVLPFGIIDGSGQLLATLHLRGGRVEPGEDVVLNQTGSRPGVLEEFVPRGSPSGPPRLLVGSQITDFRGVAVAPTATRVLVAADGRGLLAVPPTLVETTRPEVIDVGDACRDVLRVGDRVLALVATGTAGALVVLEANAAAVTVVARHDLPRGYDRFVR